MAFHSVEALKRAAGEFLLWQAVQADDCRDSGSP